MICKNGQEHDGDCIEVCSLFSFWNTYRYEGVFQRELRGFSKGGSTPATSAPTTSAPTSSPTTSSPTAAPSTTPTATAVPSTAPSTAPTAAPTSAPSTVFVTSSRQGGNLGGIQGADEICQNLADSNGFPAGTYLAWLSNSTTSPSDRFVKSNGPYVLKNGTLIANNYDDLTDGTLDFPIVLDETGTEQPPAGLGISARMVWTATKADGTTKSSINCNEWNSGATVDGHSGSLIDVGSKWSDLFTNGCGNSHRLYCFQQ